METEINQKCPFLRVSEVGSTTLVFLAEQNIFFTSRLKRGRKTEKVYALKAGNKKRGTLSDLTKRGD